MLLLLLAKKYEVGLLRGCLFSCFRVYEWHCYRYGGKKLEEIAEHFDIGESGVSRASRRISLKIGTDRNLGASPQLEYWSDGILE